MEFALEKYLEDFIVDNWDKIDFGEKLKIFIDENGNIGKQYFTDEAGYIDILAKDKDGFVIIELKKGRKNDEVVGQVLRYTGWVRRNLAKANEKVRGIIIVREKDKRLEYALQEVGDKVSIKIYSISFRLKDY
jgi:restriction system protein